MVRLATGRKASPEGTVRVLRNGYARLSREMCVEGQEFVPAYDRRNGRIILYPFTAKRFGKEAKRLRVWQNEGAVSWMISLAGTIREMDEDPKKLAGVYRASKQLSTIVVDLNQRLK